MRRLRPSLTPRSKLAAQRHGPGARRLGPGEQRRFVGLFQLVEVVDTQAQLQAFFGALVPGAASMLAIPALGEVSSLPQVLGIVAVVAGLLLAFGAAGLLLSRRVQATPAGTAGPHRRGRINAAAGYSAAHGL